MYSIYTYCVSGLQIFKSNPNLKLKVTTQWKRQVHTFFDIIYNYGVSGFRSFKHHVKSLKIVCSMYSIYTYCVSGLQIFKSNSNVKLKVTRVEKAFFEFDLQLWSFRLLICQNFQISNVLMASSNQFQIF